MAPAAEVTETRRSATVGINTARTNLPTEAQTLTVLPLRASAWPEDPSFCHKRIMPGTSTEAKGAQKANAVMTCNGRSQIEPLPPAKQFKSPHRHTIVALMPQGLPEKTEPSGTQPHACWHSASALQSEGGGFFTFWNNPCERRRTERLLAGSHCPLERQSFRNQTATCTQIRSAWRQSTEAEPHSAVRRISKTSLDTKSQSCLQQ